MSKKKSKFYLIVLLVSFLFIGCTTTFSDSFKMEKVIDSYKQLNNNLEIIYDRNFVLDSDNARFFLEYITIFQKNLTNYSIQSDSILYARLLSDSNTIYNLNTTLDQITSFLVTIITRNEPANEKEIRYFLGLLNDIDKQMYFIECDKSLTYDGIISDYIKYFLIFIIFFFILCVVLLVIFIFELKQRDMKLLETSKFLNYTIEGQEEEKQRIARELHDSLAQDMRYAIQLTKTLDSSDLQKKILKTQKDCLNEVRDICSSFVPPDIENKDLVSSLNNIIQKLQTQTNIETKITILDNINFKNMDEDRFLNFFRIIQEILSNAQEHSGATEVSILIKRKIIDDVNFINLIITDDGIGIDKQLVKSINEQKISVAKKHFGLRNIIQRVKLLNGEVTFTSDKDFGTEISIIFPEPKV